MQAKRNSAAAEDIIKPRRVDTATGIGDGQLDLAPGLIGLEYPQIHPAAWIGEFQGIADQVFYFLSSAEPIISDQVQQIPHRRPGGGGYHIIVCSIDR
jgi:hypothetical protein